MNEIFAIWDSKAEYYMPPFFERNELTAIRALEAALKPEHPIYQHAEDYQLFHVGTWNPETGTIQSTVPKHITNAWVIKAQLTNDQEVTN